MTSNVEIYGLVLSGGKSTRMGTDKGLISYHGMPQREYLYHLLDKVCTRTFISLREEQLVGLPKGMAVIMDEDLYKGPYNGLLSAHHAHPNVAWLVLACDLPLIDLQAITYLISQRNTKMLATAFSQKEDPLPEPLCALWEPHALAASISYLASGNGTCPRKFLINNEVQLVYPKNPNVLLNANSIEDYQEALSKLSTV